MQQWILPTISEILAASAQKRPSNYSEEEFVAVEQQWRVAIAALEQLLLDFNVDNTLTDNCLTSAPGVLLTGPMPVLSNKLLTKIPAWIFTPDLHVTGGTQLQLPPATKSTAVNAVVVPDVPSTGRLLPIMPGDPLQNEQFCLVLTAQFSLVIALKNVNSAAFSFSFEPEVVKQAWRALRARIAVNQAEYSQLDALVERYSPVAPDYRIVMQFSRLLLQNLPLVSAHTTPQSETHFVSCSDVLSTAPSRHQANTPEAASIGANGKSISPFPRPDVELLQAFAHEVRTPLTTIRTLTRLLLKRRDLSTDAIKRLETIDRECSEQIDRMELLFHAAELEKSNVKQTNAYLTPMSLSQVLQQSIPRWQKQASRRNLTLDVVLPQQLPTVVSDPQMLDRVLTGLIENYTGSLPCGSHVQVQVIPAGDQIKLQLVPSQGAESGKPAPSAVPPIRKSLGQLLTFQPETGNITLNLTATKQLFQAIGGKLIVRQHPLQGEVLTVYLPLELT